MARPDSISTPVTLQEDGKYRWVYAMSLYKNPTIFSLIWKIFFFILLGIFALMLIVDAIDWEGFAWDRTLQTLKIFGYFLIGMTVLVGLGYLIYALIMGGKYLVEFEMDEQGVRHRQIEWQAKRAKKLGQATMIAGAASGRLSTVAVGMNSQRTEMYSDFSKTKKVKAYPRRHLIKVNGTLNHNQVYALPGDFEFVKSFILSHCPNLK